MTTTKSTKVHTARAPRLSYFIQPIGNLWRCRRRCWGTVFENIGSGYDNGFPALFLCLSVHGCRLYEEVWTWERWNEIKTQPLFVTVQPLSQISGRILFGAGCSGVHASLELYSEQGYHDQPNSSAENWSVFTDSALAPQAEKLIYHLVRWDCAERLGVPSHPLRFSISFFLTFLIDETNR